jgi:hypothetical protein
MPHGAKSDTMVTVVWHLKTAGYCPWCFICKYGEYIQHAAGSCHDDSAVLAGFDQSLKSETHVIHQAYATAQNVICYKCWLLWPTAKHGPFQTKQDCAFMDILPWLMYAILRDPDAIKTYRTIFHLGVVTYGPQDVEEALLSLKEGELGLWKAVRSLNDVFSAEKAVGVPNLEETKLP